MPPISGRYSRTSYARLAKIMGAKWRRKSRALATRPRMMSKGLAFKRHNQVSSKCFYFKQNGQIATPGAQDSFYQQFRTQNMLVPPLPTNILDLFSLYDQYKILAMKVRLYPANVGTEPGQVLASAVWNRGDQIVWSDQRVDTAIVPIFVSEVINNASAKMINPRRPYARTIFRAKGHPQWGSCVNYQNDPDDWDASIEILGNNATPGRTLWFYTIQWKVVVRGRRQG